MHFFSKLKESVNPIWYPVGDLDPSPKYGNIEVQVGRFLLHVLEKKHISPWHVPLTLYSQGDLGAV